MRYHDEADEYDYPSTGPHASLSQRMRELEKSLTCGVCKEFLRNPRMLEKCGHVFCLICVTAATDATKVSSTAAKIEMVCPVCKVGTGGGKPLILREVQGFAEVVAKFKNSRADLLTLLHAPALYNGFQHDQPSAKKARMQSTVHGKVITEPKARWNFDAKSKKPEFIKVKLREATEQSRVPILLTGDTEALLDRYRRFMDLHNAQVGDRHSALTLDQVVEAINQQEKLKKKNNAAPKPTDAQLKAGYEMLLEKAKEEKKAKKAKDEAKGEAKENSAPAPPRPLLPSFPQVTCGDWRVVLSEKLDAPFFFNTATDTGQWTAPPEFLELVRSKTGDGDDVDERAEDDQDEGQAEAEDEEDEEDEEEEEEEEERREKAAAAAAPLPREARSQQRHRGRGATPTSGGTAATPMWVLDSDSEDAAYAGLASQTQVATQVTQTQQPTQTQAADMTWSCSVCTYLNKTALCKCAMCSVGTNPNPPVVQTRSSIFFNPKKAQAQASTSSSSSSSARAKSSGYGGGVGTKRAKR